MENTQPTYTSLTNTLLLGAIVIITSLLIFFQPLILGKKEPAIAAAVQQNMVFLKEMVEKYIQQNAAPPANLTVLLRAAREKNFNKTFFNPINKHTGDLDSRFIAVQYSPEEFKRLDANFSLALYAGMLGYYSDGKKYVIYGHGRDGSLIRQQGQISRFGELK